MNAREVIAKALLSCIRRGTGKPWPEVILSDLSAAGFTIMSKEDVEAVREGNFEEVAKWHDKNARICLEVSKDEPRMSADDRKRALVASKHHAASAAAIRNKMVGERRVAIRSLKSGGRDGKEALE